MKRPTLVYPFHDGTTHTVPAGDQEYQDLKELQKYAEMSGDHGPLQARLDRIVTERLAIEQRRTANADGGRKRKGTEEWTTIAVRKLLREFAHCAQTHQGAFEALTTAAADDVAAVETVLAGNEGLELDGGTLWLTREGRTAFKVTKKVVARIRAQKK